MADEPIKGTDQSQTEQRSVTTNLLTDAAIVAAPVVGAWAQAHFGKGNEPTEAQPPPPRAQEQPPKD
jgi:hypothetical protein